MAIHRKALLVQKLGQAFQQVLILECTAAEDCLAHTAFFADPLAKLHSHGTECIQKGRRHVADRQLAPLLLTDGGDQRTPVDAVTAFFFNYFIRINTLNAFVSGEEIIVTAEKYARSVEIQCGADVLLEDNFFDMDGGTRTVKILRGNPDFVSVRSVYDIR